jgi:hypothetical protein
VLAALTEKKAFDDQLKADLNKALEEFGKTFVTAVKTPAA